MTLASTFGNKVSLITGGSSGIGLALARRIAELGGEVVLVARREQPLVDAATQIRARVPGARVETLALDVSDEDAVVGLPCERLVMVGGGGVPGVPCTLISHNE